MKDTNDALFQIMRFNILNSGLSGIENSPFSPEYLYAWVSGVFPVFDECADWHKPFSKQFDVSEEEILELKDFLLSKWEEKTPICFYELESHYGVSASRSSSNWNRVKLIHSCRYMYLNEMFDDSFWESLVENTKCPAEALHLCRPMESTDISFM
jgi:hypothetical protein